MTTRTRRAAYNLPLVVRPVIKDYRINGPNSELAVNIHACPEQTVRYKFSWTRRPPEGRTAACEGQVTLMRTASGKRADILSKVRATSDGKVYAGLITGDYSQHQLRDFQLHD